MRKTCRFPLIAGSASAKRLRSFPLMGLSEDHSWPRQQPTRNVRDGRNFRPTCHAFVPRRGYGSWLGGELTFGACAPIRSTLVLATAPRETFKRAGTGRKAGTSLREAIRRGHFYLRGAHTLRMGTPVVS